MEPNSNIELYVLGALNEEERVRFEEEVRMGNVDLDRLREALETFGSMCEEVAAEMPAPRKALREEVIAAVTGGDSLRTSQLDQYILRGEEGEWVESGIPGIRMRVLFQDQERKRYTVMVKFDPGAEYPRHRHKGIEECMVLEGDLRMDDIVLNAGDFAATFAHRKHNVTRSDTGCVLLLNTPMDDEFI